MEAPRRVTLAVTIGLAVAACTDTLDVSEDSRYDIAVQGASAPTLETYSASFWAVQGRATTFLVHYVEAGDTLHPYMSLIIPQKAQIARPDGTLLANGDSLLISVELAQEKFQVEFAPHGLVFAADEPMRLKFWYEFAALDDGGGGRPRDVADLTLLYRPEPDHPWVRLDSEVSLQGHFVVANVHHFSGYAVAW